MNPIITQTRDPVCGMTVQENAAAIAWEFQNVRYLFCAEACKQQFMEKPDQYATAPMRPRRTTIVREITIAAALFAAALIIVFVILAIQRKEEKSADRDRQVAATQTAAGISEREKT